MKDSNFTLRFSFFHDKLQVKIFLKLCINNN